MGTELRGSFTEPSSTGYITLTQARSMGLEDGVDGLRPQKPPGWTKVSTYPVVHPWPNKVRYATFLTQLRVRELATNLFLPTRKESDFFQHDTSSPTVALFSL